MNEVTNDKPIALALSGGGVRAMVFHLGVLRFLAEHGQLEKVTRLSTVSGGSLVAGLLFKESGMVWPTSVQFIDSVLPGLREKLCTRSVQWRALLHLLKPWNLRYLLSRANLLSFELREGWGVSERLAELPKTPEWSINGTTAENGKRFRFKRDDLGDYKLGYASSNDFLLSDAMAVSTAFPGGIGPLVMNATRFIWKRKTSWDSGEDLKVVPPIFKRLHLYDGGLYDNLGLEPFFDSGKATPKIEGEFIIASDAGSPLSQGFPWFSLNPWRLKRIVEIT